jgi:hypothetical protein
MRAVESVMEGSDRPARRGNFESNLDLTFKREQPWFNPRREAATLVFLRRCHGQVRWLARAGTSMRYGLRLRAVLGSNQSGGRGVLTKRFFGQRRSPEEGVQRQGLRSCPRQWWEGAPRGCFNWFFAKRVRHRIGKLIGQSPWPKTPSRGSAMRGSGG